VAEGGGSLLRKIDASGTAWGPFESVSKRESVPKRVSVTTRDNMIAAALSIYSALALIGPASTLSLFLFKRKTSALEKIGAISVGIACTIGLAIALPFVFAGQFDQEFLDKHTNELVAQGLISNPLGFLIMTGVNRRWQGKAEEKRLSRTL
jgi:Na+(H+)/acetate symporter ActP